MLPPLFCEMENGFVHAVDANEIELMKAVNHINVNIVGLKNIEIKQIESDCEYIKQAVTVHDLLRRISSVQQMLLKTGCFTNVIPSVASTNSDHIDVQLTVTEARNNVSLGSSINQKGNISADLLLRAPCLLGRYHSASFDGHLTRDKDFEMQATYSMARFLKLRSSIFDLQLQFFNQKIYNNVSSSYSEAETGARLKLLDDSQVIQRLVTLESVMRNIDLISSTTSLPSFGLLQVPKETWKSSLKFALALNKTMALPFLFRFTEIKTQTQGVTEMAYLHAQDFPFCKFQGCFNLFHVLLKNWALTCRLSFGLIISPKECFNKFWQRSVKRTFNELEEKLPLQDRFYLGGACGPGSSLLNGFVTRSLGPASPRRQWVYPELKPSSLYAYRGPLSFDYLGGTSYSSIHVSLSRRLFSIQHPKLPQLSPSAFFFINAGFLGNSALAWNFTGLNRQTRAAAGFGMSLPFGENGSLEFVMCQPLRASSSDLTSTFQLGFRVNNLSVG